MHKVVFGSLPANVSQAVTERFDDWTKLETQMMKKEGRDLGLLVSVETVHLVQEEVTEFLSHHLAKSHDGYCMIIMTVEKGKVRIGTSTACEDGK